MKISESVIFIGILENFHIDAPLSLTKTVGLKKKVAYLTWRRTITRLCKEIILLIKFGPMLWSFNRLLEPAQLK